MFKKLVVSVAAILLLSSAGLASIGQAQGWTVATNSGIANTGYIGSGTGSNIVTIAHCQMENFFRGMTAFHHPTFVVGLQPLLKQVWCFYWPPCPYPCRPCPHPCPPTPPPCPPSCSARGGDASATATAISDGGSASASAQAVAGDASAGTN